LEDPKDSIRLKIVNIEDHKRMEVAWLYQIIQVDRQEGEVLLIPATKSFIEKLKLIPFSEK
jgi:hypothetical protein